MASVGINIEPCIFCLFMYLDVDIAVEEGYHRVRFFLLLSYHNF